MQWKSALRTPTGFHPGAPGCGVPAATRGQRSRIPPNPNGVVSRLGTRCRGDGAGPPQGRNPFRVGASWRAWIPGVAPRASGQPRAAGRNRVAVGGPAIVVCAKTTSLFAQWPLRPCRPTDLVIPDRPDPWTLTPPHPIPISWGEGVARRICSLALLAGFRGFGRDPRRVKWLG